MAGNWTDLVALGLSGAALVIAGMAWWQSKRSADAGEASADSSARSAAAGERAADAAVASARAADSAVALEAARFEAEYPGISFALPHRGMLFRVHNTGRHPAERVRVLTTARDVVYEVVRLEPQEVSDEFKVVSTWQSGTIEFLLVDCDGLDGPIAVRISDPPRQPKPQSPPRRVR